MSFQRTGYESPSMNGVHEPEAIFGLAFLALRPDLDRELPRAGHILRSAVLAECDASGAPPLRAERAETETHRAQFSISDIASLYIDDAQLGVALVGRPGDTEDERGVQRGPN